MLGSRPGIRQRTILPRPRVSHSRTAPAHSHRAGGSVRAVRRWRVRTAGLPNQRSRRSSGVWSASLMRLIQHKKEAWWFYRFLSIGYDDWVNPLFWTPRMRAEALAAARLDA